MYLLGGRGGDILLLLGEKGAQLGEKGGGRAGLSAKEGVLFRGI